MSRADLVTTMAAASSARTGSLKRGQPVTLVGFGTFSVSRRKPRRGKNPRTGQPMHVAGGRTPRFKPSRELKRAVR